MGLARPGLIPAWKIPPEQFTVRRSALGAFSVNYVSIDRSPKLREALSLRRAVSPPLMRAGDADGCRLYLWKAAKDRSMPGDGVRAGYGERFRVL